MVTYLFIINSKSYFTKLLKHLRAYFLDYPIKKIFLDNVGEFTSHAFHEYCISIEIEVEHLVVHVHTQNV